MPTPSTRTPVRIARGSYSNLNGSVSDLQDGEISYAEDQDKLYIKEGASLVALTYTPASPAFTGTITGVNLTLSGNLTVNGTQTIINTQTLDVEDKQIEIGKVSSPSDTTADQGGIILKGASDKSILWVNATDTWDFNQGIKTTGGLTVSGTTLIGTTTAAPYSTRKLTVGDTTFGDTAIEIRSSSTTTGRIYFTDSSTSGEGAYQGEIKFDHGAESANVNKFSFNIGNSTKFSLDSSTASFAGTVSDSKGNLRSIPRLDKTSAYTITAADAGKTITADGNITIPNSVMAEGDAITIIADGTADITITQGSGFVMYNAADASTGNRTLALRGMATIWFKHTSYGYISGAGLS